MDAEVYFEETKDSYQFSKTKDGDGAFVIKKDDLIFETKTFYEYFFKDLAEKPQYTVVDLHENEPDHKLAGQAKHVFLTTTDLMLSAGAPPGIPMAMKAWTIPMSRLPRRALGKNST